MTAAQTILDELVRTANDQGFTAHGIHVRAGDASATHFWSADEPRDIQSVAKAVCALAAVIAQDDGVFDLDAPVQTYLPELVRGAGVEHVTPRRLLGMTSGIDLPWSPTLMTDWTDLAAEFLSRPSTGTHFQYSNASTYTAMRALAAVVGDVPAWLGPRLFEPLGLGEPVWERCPNGWIVAGGGLHLRLAELARIGQLIADGGTFDGRRLVSEDGVRLLHSEWSEHEAEPMYRRFALAGWAGPDPAWRLHGAYGQLVIFLPEAVVTIFADDHEGADEMARQVVRIVEAYTGLSS